MKIELNVLNNYKAPFAIMTVGIPASGKTTYIEKNILPYIPDIIVISPDTIRQELSGNMADQSVNAEAWDLAYARAGEALKQGKSIIFDATYARRDKRKADIKFYKDSGATAVICIYFRISLQVAQQRNISRERTVPKHALVRMHNWLMANPPSLKDGFNDIITVNMQ